jgi:hypothetical protein
MANFTATPRQWTLALSKRLPTRSATDYGGDHDPCADGGGSFDRFWSGIRLR